jgi:hypothetical protein
LLMTLMPSDADYAEVMAALNAVTMPNEWLSLSFRVSYLAQILIWRTFLCPNPVSGDIISDSIGDWRLAVVALAGKFFIDDIGARRDCSRGCGTGVGLTGIGSGQRWQREPREWQ